MAGYIGSKAVTLSTTAADVTGNAIINGDLTVKGTTLTVDSAAAQEIRLGDNDKLTFGDATGGDLQIYHDGFNSYIDDAGTGGLIVRADNFYVRKANDVENMIIGSADGAVTLYHDNATKLATTSTGVDITGTLTSDALNVSAASPNIDVTDTGTSHASQDFLTNSNAVRATIGVERSTGGGLFVGSSAYAAVFGTASSGNTQFATNNNVRMTLDSSGNVGIGTDSPSRQLSLYGSLAAIALQTSSTGTTSGDGFQVQMSGTEAYLWNYENSRIYLGTNNSHVMQIGSNGHVGIGTGTLAPVEDLHIKGTNPRINVEGDGSSYYPSIRVTGVNGGISLGTYYGGNISGENGIVFLTGSSATDSGTERMRIDSAGRVTTPYQPVFSYLGSHSYSIAATGTQTMSSSNVWAASVNHALNRGSHFNPSTGRFTAPVAGTYHFQFTCTASDFGSGYLWFYMNVNGSAKSYVQASQQTEHTMIVHNFYFDLSANDYVSVQWTNNYVSGKINYPGFSGYLVG